MKNKYIKPLLCLFILMLALLACFYKAGLYSAVRFIDKNYLSESLKDIRASFYSNESWAGLPDEAKYDYSWLERTEKPIRIAHALGGRNNANTMEAFYQSRAAGFTFYEVDIWLDEKGRLRCHHGPNPPDENVRCTLFELSAVLKPDEYLVLDIKTEFKTTFDAIMNQLPQKPLKRMIFQLYLPDHVMLFNTYNKQEGLLGPIISVYVSQRSLTHIYKNISTAGIRAFAFPYPRMVALKSTNDDILLMTYPVRNCEETEMALAMGVEALYIRNDLNCEAE